MDQPWPTPEERYLVADSVSYPISFNGKVRFQLELPASMSKEDIEAQVVAHEQTLNQLDGDSIRKVIVVPGRIVNVVV